MEKKLKVLVIATSRRTRGGITAVVKAHESGSHWKKFHCRWIETHRDGNRLRKIGYLICSFAEYLCLIPFYQLVHIHLSTPVSAKRKYLFYKITRLFHKKTIIHLHCGSQIDSIWSPLYDKMFKDAEKCLVLSETIKTKVEEHIGHRENLCVLYNPCLVIACPVKKEVKPYILFAGTLIPAKGYADLITAFARIAGKYPDWSVVFAGNGEVEQGKALAKELGIENQTFFPGWVNGEAKEKVFGEASVFCLPSYAEGFPMAVLDAWAYGLPVVATPVGGLPDIAEEGKNILLFTPGDTDGLAAQLDKILSDPGLRRDIAEESLKLSRTTFSIETISRQLDEIYSNI